MSSIARRRSRRHTDLKRTHGSQTRRRRLDRKQRRRRTRKARAAQRRLQRNHERLPQPARSLFETLAGSFTRPTTAQRGDTLLADYGPLGSVAFRFA